MPTYADPEHAPLVSRTMVGRVAHEGTGNDDNAGHHHGVPDLHEVTCCLALYWHSRTRGHTVQVGTHKLNLRRLVAGGYAQEKHGRKVRLRFVREADGTIAIRPNQSALGLSV